MRALDGTIHWAKAHERHLSALFMAGGFAFDSWAFGRIDHAATQTVFIVYLLTAGVAIAVLHALESRPEPLRPSPRVRAVFMFATQFALGALLSGFCVFYIRSASIVSSWPFLLFMAAIFVGNEYFRHYHSRLVFVALLLFFSIYSYAIMLVPVLVGRIGLIPFLASGASAVLLFFLYGKALASLGHDRYHGARMQIWAGMVLITVLFNAFYVFRIFPPLPLVLTDAGIYHLAKKEGDSYRVSEEAEPAAWRALFGTFPVMHIQPGAKLYLYSAVFAPSRLTTSIQHRWEWRDPATGAWRLQQARTFAINGGRDDGYRAYTIRSAPKEGQWRVNITTADGRAIGRVRFSVEWQAVPPAVMEKVLN